MEFEKEDLFIEKEYIDKPQRLIDIFYKLLQGGIVDKTKLIDQYKISERTAQRDMNSLKWLFDSNNLGTVEYDKTVGGYYLDFNTKRGKLTNSEVLAVCKILIDSRAFSKNEMQTIVDKIMSQCYPVTNYKFLYTMVNNEMYHYVEPKKKRNVLDKIWDIGKAIENKNKLKIVYNKMKNDETVERIVDPVAIMFSEYYFYVLCFIENIDKEKEFQNKDDEFPTIYRIDRISKYQVLEEKFIQPYKNRFEEGIFRKKVQFMTGGKTRKIKFVYFGNSLEAILDRLPTAEVIGKDEKGYPIIKAEVFGNGIDRWILAQGDSIKVLEDK